MTPHTIEAVGIDPGSTYFGFGHVILKGLIELVNTKGDVVKIIPNIGIRKMERWNLKTRQIFCRSPTGGLLVKLIDEITKQPISDNLPYWSNALSDAVATSNNIFEHYDSLIGNRPLPILVTENQCDKNKGEPNEAYKRYEMTVISYIFRSSVRAIDTINTEERISIFAGKKYNMPSDGTIGSRVDRKKRAVEVLKELLFELGLIDWLDWLNEMERLGEQIHDMADAILLAIASALKLADIKKDMTQKRSTTAYPRVDISVTQLKAPSELELLQRIKPVRKQRAPTIKRTTSFMGRTFIVPLVSTDDGNDGDDDECNDVRKMNSQQKTVLKNKRKSDNDLEDDSIVKKKRKYTKKSDESNKIKRKSDNDLEDDSIVKKKRKYTKKIMEPTKNDIININDAEDEPIVQRTIKLTKRKADNNNLSEEEEGIEKKKRKYTKNTSKENVPDVHLKYPILLFERSLD